MIKQRTPGSNIFLQLQQARHHGDRGHEGPLGMGDWGPAHYFEDEDDDLPILHIGSSSSSSRSKRTSSSSRSKGKGGISKGKGGKGGRPYKMMMRMMAMRGMRSKSSRSKYYLLPPRPPPPPPPPIPIMEEPEEVEETESPTGAPTMLPTLAPTSMEIMEAEVPERSPTQCQTNPQNGLFGVSTRGDENLAMYVYQVETQPEITQQQFESEIIPQIEIETANGIIPSLFGSLCELTSRQRQLQLQFATARTTALSDKAMYLGISTQPTDLVVEDVDCSGSFFQRPCYVVAGAMTVYSVHKTAEQVQTETLWVINDLDQEALVSTIPGVNKVTIRGSLAVIDQGTISPTIPLVVFDPDLTPPPTPLLATAPPTITATTLATTTTTAATALPTIAPTQSPLPNELDAAAEPKAEDDGGLDWWRWLLVVIIILFMFAASYYVYKRCGDSPPGQPVGHSTFSLEDE